MEHLSLTEFNALIRETIALQFRHSYWITAELSDVHVAANGHCYMTLIEKAEKSNQIVARANAHIWKSLYPMLSLLFRNGTGMELESGLKILAEVQIDFHDIYGLSLNIVGIDPTYTLGDQARQRQEILDQLEKDGVIDLNKELPLPRPLNRIAVISSNGAAGYGDFLRQIQESGLHFRLRLFEAVMQGNQVEPSIIAALEEIAKEIDCWDAVAILRGGGSTSDLMGFESYLLAANVAQFPLPILTGIGHERDDTVIDFVANTRLKTPTAVAAFLIERQQRECDLVDDLGQRLLEGVSSLIDNDRQWLKNTSLRLQTVAIDVIRREERRFHACEQSLQMASATFSRQRLTQLQQFTTRLHTATLRQLQNARISMEILPQRIRHAANDLFKDQQNAITRAENSLKILDPQNTLKRGFSITTHNGKALHSTDTLKPGDRITTRLEHGYIESEVESISHKKKP